MYYSVNVGPAHFLMLNSYISFQNGSAQFAFVEQDLAAYAAANQRYANGSSSGLTPYVTFMCCIALFPSFKIEDLFILAVCIMHHCINLTACWCSKSIRQ